MRPSRISRGFRSSKGRHQEWGKSFESFSWISDYPGAGGGRGRASRLERNTICNISTRCGAVQCLLVDLWGLEGAGVVVEGLARHLLVHHVWQPQLRQHPLAPIPGWVLVRLRRRSTKSRQWMEVASRRSLLEGRWNFFVPFFSALQFSSYGITSDYQIFSVAFVELGSYTGTITTSWPELRESHP